MIPVYRRGAICSISTSDRSLDLCCCNDFAHMEVWLLLCWLLKIDLQRGSDGTWHGDGQRRAVQLGLRRNAGISSSYVSMMNGSDRRCTHVGRRRTSYQHFVYSFAGHGVIGTTSYPSRLVIGTCPQAGCSFRHRFGGTTLVAPVDT